MRSVRQQLAPETWGAALPEFPRRFGTLANFGNIIVIQFSWGGGGAPTQTRIQIPPNGLQPFVPQRFSPCFAALHFVQGGLRSTRGHSAALSKSDHFKEPIGSGKHIVRLQGLYWLARAISCAGNNRVRRRSSASDTYSEACAVLPTRANFCHSPRQRCTLRRTTEGSMRRTAIFAAAVIFAATAIQAGPQTQTSASKIEALAAASREVDVYHTPERLMGRLGRTKDTAAQDWLVRETYRCNSTCNYELQELRRLLSGAVATTARDLKGDISTVIIFRDGSREVGRIHGAWSGEFLLIDGRVYRSSRSLAEFLETHTPFQW
jgi:hypothetical protein